MRFRKRLVGIVLASMVINTSSVFSMQTFAKDNGTMMQYFEWDLSYQDNLWNKMKNDSRDLKNSGITSFWIPPAYKACDGKDGVGYAAYDLYDLGEFNQKGSKRTKYGTKEELHSAIKAAHEAGIRVYGDIVLNHKMGADNVEKVRCVEVSPNNRNQEISRDFDFNAYTSFTFGERQDKYSDFKWHWYHFTGIDEVQQDNSKKIFKIRGEGKSWNWEVEGENGNYDYLMGADIDYNHPEVVKETNKWGEWFTNTLNLDGYRLDAVKHIKFDFYKNWLNNQRSKSGKELFTVGEYWSEDLGKLQNYINKTDRTMSLFDVPLHKNFYDASTGSGYFDMRNIQSSTLVGTDPVKAVTFVDNHDTQPGQAFSYSYVQSWFKPLAYTFILTRDQGYPCVFYGDYYGIPSKGIEPMKPKLDSLLLARKDYAYGPQHDYFDNKDIVGWTREGDQEHAKSGLAALITDGNGGSKWMYVGKHFSGKTFYDCTGNRQDFVTINKDGWGEFKVNGGSNSVWIQK